MEVRLSLSEPKSKLKKTKNNPALDNQLQKKLDQYLLQQNIKLNPEQKKAVFNLITQYQTSSTDHSSYDDKTYKQVQNIFNNLQFNYDGTVNYRQQMATFNIAAKYQKDNLWVQARIPSILDFKNFKLYTNVNAVLPFLTDPAQGNGFAYFDFSRFAPFASDFDKKALIEFLKEMSVVSYLMTPDRQFEQIPLSAEEVKQGGVEKIRIRANSEEWMLHSGLFTSVNLTYLMNSILKID